MFDTNIALELLNDKLPDQLDLIIQNRGLNLSLDQVIKIYTLNADKIFFSDKKVLKEAFIEILTHEKYFSVSIIELEKIILYIVDTNNLYYIVQTTKNNFKQISI